MQTRCGSIWKQRVAQAVRPTTHRVNRRLAEDDFPGTRGTDPEVSQVLARAGGHPAPDPRPGATQFRAHRPLNLSGHQQEDRIAPAVRVQLAGLNERLDDRHGKATASREILTYPVQQAIIGDGSPQRAGLFSSRGLSARIVRDGFAAGERAGRQVLLEPAHCRAEVNVGQVHHQVDRPAATLGLVPVHELGARDRQRALFGVPFTPVVPIAYRAANQQHGLQRHRPDGGGTPTEVVEVHSASPSPPSSSLGRKLWQFFMLITWLVSVSRLSRAPVR